MSGGGTFDNVDVQTVSYRTQDFVTSLGVNTIPEAQQRFSDIDRLRTSQDQSYQTNQLWTSTVANDRTFQTNTDLLAQLNESWNSNAYIVQSLGAETKRVGALDNVARRDVYRLRQNEMHTVYMINYYKFATRVLIFTLYVTLLALIPAAIFAAGRMAMWLLVGIESILLAIYLLVLIVVYYKSSIKRTTAWDKYYWSVKDVTGGVVGEASETGCAVTTPTSSSTSNTAA